MSSELLPEDPRRLGPFTLLRRLGQGGMGRVYLGYHVSRLVAVKTIRTDIANSGDFRERFAREVEAARKVSGFFTPAVVDADATAPVPWLATDYVRAPSLAELVREHGPLPVHSVRQLAAGLAEALAAIHRAELVHRDLKPSNILIAADGPRIIDFGIARPPAVHTYTQYIGTPDFMPPEMVGSHGALSSASDVYSLGATLILASTGHAAHRGENKYAIFHAVSNGEVNLADVPSELLPLIRGCMRFSQGERLTTAEIIRDLGPYVRRPDPDGAAASWLPPAMAAFVTTYGAPVEGEPHRWDEHSGAYQHASWDLVLDPPVEGMFGLEVSGDRLLSRASRECLVIDRRHGRVSRRFPMSERTFRWGSGAQSVASGIVSLGDLVFDVGPRAIDVRSGRGLWRKERGLRPILACKDLCFCTTGDSGYAVRRGITAFRAETGEELWTAELPHSPAFVTCDGGKLIAVSGPGWGRDLGYPTYLSLVNAETGSVLWTTELLLTAPWSEPALCGPVVAVRGVTGRVAGYNLSDGSQRWSREIPGAKFVLKDPEPGPPVVAVGDSALWSTSLGLMSFESKLFRFDAANGLLMASPDLGAYGAGWDMRVLASYSRVFVVTGDMLTAFDPPSGGVLWQKRLRSRPYSLCAAGDRIYLQDVGGIYCLAAEDADSRS